MIMYQSIRTRKYIEERITAHEPVSSEQKQIETPVAMVTPGIDLAYCDFAPPVIKYTYDADGAEHEHFTGADAVRISAAHGIAGVLVVWQEKRRTMMF